MSAAALQAGAAVQDAVDAGLFRRVMGQFATGVTVITWLADGQPAAMTANAFMSVSLEPPLVLVSVRRAARFAAQMRAGERYGVSFLGERQQELSAHFGGRPVDGLAVPFAQAHGVPLIDGALAQIAAEVVAVHEAGDHLLYLGRVLHLAQGNLARGNLAQGVQAAPLIFCGGQYRQLKPGKPSYCWESVDGW